MPFPATSPGTIRRANIHFASIVLLALTAVSGQAGAEDKPLGPAFEKPLNNRRAEPLEEPLFYGATLSTWHERMKNIAPTSNNALPLVSPFLSIIQDESIPGADREPFAAYLARMGPKAGAAVALFSRIIDQRHQTSGQDYLWAARALALMGADGSEATPALVDLLFDQELPAKQRQAAVEALALIGAAHPDAIPALLRLLQLRPSRQVSDRDAARLRLLAAECMYIAGSECVDLAGPLLIRMIRNPAESESARRAAVMALGKLTAGRAMAAPVLVEELVNGQNPALRDAAAQSLLQLGAEALPLALRCFAHPDPEVRWRVAGSARLLPTDHAVLGATLRRALEDSSADVQINAAESAVSLFGKNEQLVRTCLSLLAAKPRDVRVRAKKLLLQMAPLSPAQAITLRNLAAAKDRRLSASAQATLDQLGIAGGEGKPAEGMKRSP